MSRRLKAPFVYPGGKARIAHVIWQALGRDVPNYIEPCCGSAAVLLNRPGGAGKIETINDLNGDIANFWRAMIFAPDAVAEAADWPVNEMDLHARSIALRETKPEFQERMHRDADFYDAKRAGIWAWGMCTAIGGNWLEPKGDNAAPRMVGWIIGNGLHAAGGLPALGHSGRGIHAPERESLSTWFRALQQRLRRVRVACGDWSRVVAGSVTGASNSLKNMGMSPCGIYFDAPYKGYGKVYGKAHEGADVSAEIREWAIEQGDDPHFRIAISGYAGEHEFPSTWRVHRWSAQGGFGNRAKDGNPERHQETIWLSPHCLALHEQPSLFSEVS